MKFLHFLLLVLVGILPAAAQNQPGFTPEHLAAAERVVYAMGMPERFIIPTKELLQRSREKDPVNGTLMSTIFEPYLQKKYTAAQLRGYFAARFDLNTCRNIAAFWEGPVGKKLVSNQIKMLTGEEPPKLVFSAREKALIKNFEATEAGRAFMQAMPEIEDVLSEFTHETQMKMRERFLNELKQQKETSSSS